MQATEHNFSSTQRFKQLAGTDAATEDATLAAQHRWLQQRLLEAPSSRWRLYMRLLRPRFSLALFAPTLCGALLAIWQLEPVPWAALKPVLLLLLFGSGGTVLGVNLLHELHDFWWAQRSSNVQLKQPIYATGYHLLATGQISPTVVMWLGYGLLWLGLGCYLGLVVQRGWPLMFFYVVGLLLTYTYSAPPVRYGYWGWGIGELGIFLGYGLLPLLGSYYIVGQQLTKMALLTTIPFGIAAVLLLGNYNVLHHRRDWLMHKRTSIVAVGLNRILSVHAILTLLIYVAFLCIVSLAHLPVIVLVTLGALPLAMRIYSELRGDEIELEASFMLYRATVTGILWTTLLFGIALLVDRFIG
ncbi:MAG: prenyltransferase [Caldilineaceae bacterium]|nr:prenyltransferase [Caldilineaceae bacterium]